MNTLPTCLFLCLSQVGIQPLQIHQRDLVLLSLGLEGCSSHKRSQSFPDEGQDPLRPVGQLVILRSDEAKRAALAMPGSVWCPAPMACRIARWARGSRTSS
jgi:hypothetical protein